MIMRGRFLYYTSFLYDYDEDAMAAMLKMLECVLVYRNGCVYGDFVM